MEIPRKLTNNFHGKEIKLSPKAKHSIEITLHITALEELKAYFDRSMKYRSECPKAT